MSKGKPPAEDDGGSYGPAMSRLNEKQRKFVEFLCGAGGPAHGSGRTSWAGRMAGYGKPDSNDHTISAIVGRLVSLPDVRAAIAEALQSQIHILAPQALQSLRELATTKNPQQVRAIEGLLNRIIAPAPTTVDVHVTDWRQPTEAVTQRVLARIAELATRAGLPKLPAPIDVPFTEVPADE
jgi:hypothetical protein